MAARTPRRSFAHPFVITLAAAVPACVAAPRHAPNPPPPQREPAADPPPPVVVANPPPPSEHLGEPVAPTEPPDVRRPPSNPPPPQQPPTPTPTVDRQWEISMDGGKCYARSNASCPPHEPGKPMRTCNPPPPRPYACIAGMTDGSSVVVLQRAGQSQCYVPPPPSTCPPKAMCNPPPPRQVPCPS